MPFAGELTRTASDEAIDSHARTDRICITASLIPPVSPGLEAAARRERLPRSEERPDWPARVMRRPRVDAALLTACAVAPLSPRRCLLARPSRLSAAFCSDAGT